MTALSGCVRPAAPAAAVIRQTAPPWDAPRDAISYLDAAGLDAEPLGSSGGARTFRLSVTYAGDEVAVPAFLGLDRVRALQAAAHTHEIGGLVWLESSRSADVTLGQLFTLWGVRFGEGCLGGRSGGVQVTVDGAAVEDPVSVSLRSVREAVVVVG